MRYAGIDFGKKRVGVALSDEGGTFALPHAVILNNKKLLPTLGQIFTEQEVSAVILGESHNYKGEANAIMKDVLVFKKRIEQELNLPVYFEPEFLTSAEAERIQGNTGMLDASAAALILKSYLDRLDRTKR